MNKKSPWERISALFWTKNWILCYSIQSLYELAAFVRQRTLILHLVQRGCLDCTIFIQDDALPLIGLLVQSIFRKHLIDSRIIICAFPTAHTSKFYPFYFWLWKYLKNIVYQGPFPDIATLKIINMSGKPMTLCF